jgi:hypothetical protein
MFCDDAPVTSIGLVPFWTPAQAKPCSSPARHAKTSAPTLYASLLHCSACEQDVRIYSKLPELLAREVRADCPCCGRIMQTRGHARQSHASDCSKTRYPERIAAWAA